MLNNRAYFLMRNVVAILVMAEASKYREEARSEKLRPVRESWRKCIGENNGWPREGARWPAAAEKYGNKTL